MGMELRVPGSPLAAVTVTEGERIEKKRDDWCCARGSQTGEHCSRRMVYSLLEFLGPCAVRSTIMELRFRTKL